MADFLLKYKHIDWSDKRCRQPTRGAGGQKTDVRGLKTENRRQMSEDPPSLKLCHGKQSIEGRKLMTASKFTTEGEKFWLTMVIDYGMKYIKI